MHVLVSIIIKLQALTYPDSADYQSVKTEEKADEDENEMTSDGIDIPYVDDETSEEREDSNF